MNRAIRYLLPAGVVLALCIGTASAHNATVRFTSTPAPNGSTPTAVAGLQYLYRAVAAASDGSTVRYGLRYGPSGMSVDAESGRVTWTPVATGTFPVGIRAMLASDPAVAADQEWSLKVTPAPIASISVDGVGGPVFCLGDSMTVAYTASGNFAPGNAFIVQLSGPSGSFSSDFRNMASIISTTSGAIGFRIPKDLPAGGTYRVRVMGSNPVTISADNGSDIRFNAFPVLSIRANYNRIDSGGTFYLQNVPISLYSQCTNIASLVWDLGADATPATSTSMDSLVVTYSTGGSKQIRLTATSPGGCMETRTFNLNVTITSPRIPADVRIVQGDEYFHDDGAHVWVCPGGTYRTKTSSNSTIYIETGGTVYLEGPVMDVIYAKSGASIIHGDHGGARMVIYEAGAGVTDWDQIQARLLVASITYDYTDAPAGGCPSLASYTKRIPDNSRRVVRKETSNESGQEFWVRGGGELTASGEHNVAAVEQGGKLVATGDNCVAYLKNGSTFDAQGSKGHRIFYEMGATIVNAGDDAAMFPSNDITFLYQGAVVSGVRDEAVAGGITMVPNPASTTVRIANNGGRITRLTLFDALGKVVREQEVGADHLDLSVASLAHGIYFVKLLTAKGVAVKELVVQ